MLRFCEARNRRYALLLRSDEFRLIEKLIARIIDFCDDFLFYCSKNYRIKIDCVKDAINFNINILII